MPQRRIPCLKRRWPISWSRKHAPAHASSTAVTTQALLAIFFLFLTAPVAAHLISRAAYKRGPDLCAETTHDEYGKYLEGQKAEEESPERYGDA